MMEAVTASETSVNFYHTARRNIPEARFVNILRRKNLKSYALKRISSYLHVSSRVRNANLFLGVVGAAVFNPSPSSYFSFTYNQLLIVDVNFMFRLTVCCLFNDAATDV
jgi:hypothetical protein